MQFLGRTEFGLSIMAVERHTHTRNTHKLRKQKEYILYAIIAARFVLSRVSAETERDAGWARVAQACSD